MEDETKNLYAFICSKKKYILYCEGGKTNEDFNKRKKEVLSQTPDTSGTNKVLVPSGWTL